VSEPEVVRHYTRLSRLNQAVDTTFYPLGSCTMKYNPKAADEAASMSGFSSVHPLAPEETCQGWLEILGRTEEMLCELCGVSRFSFQPAAGAQGELCGLLIARGYHRDRGGGRSRVIVPDSAHGTNPASASLAGFDVAAVPSNSRGRIDLAALKSRLDSSVAAVMVTNPNTLGLFEDEILEAASLVHEVGGLLYYDGANLNALVGRFRPGDMGFDIVQLNLHKTFATPHGGGGPGSGPVGVKDELEPYLPVPVLERREACPPARAGLRPESEPAARSGWFWDWNRPRSIGKLTCFTGNSLVVLRAYVYLCLMGGAGLAQASGDAVLNANYLLHRLSEAYDVPHPGPCMHEFVLSAARLKSKGVRAWDIAKRLIDYGFHPPTVHFPLVVPEAIMVEPTETESKATLDAFADALIQIAGEAEQEPEILLSAPQDTPVGRLDETEAARHPMLRWKPGEVPSD
jgi:glycine dehydrogenase subunit 2